MAVGLESHVIKGIVNGDSVESQLELPPIKRDTPVLFAFYPPAVNGEVAYTALGFITTVESRFDAYFYSFLARELNKPIKDSVVSPNAPYFLTPVMERIANLSWELQQSIGEVVASLAGLKLEANKTAKRVKQWEKGLKLCRPR